MMEESNINISPGVALIENLLKLKNDFIRLQIYFENQTHEIQVLTS